jgi:hypothetical protein
MLPTSLLDKINAEAKTTFVDVRKELRNVQFHPKNCTHILARSAQFALSKLTHAVGNVATA